MAECLLWLMEKQHGFSLFLNHTIADVGATFLIWASGLSCAHVGAFFQLAGGAVLAVGVWTLVEKSDYISLLSSSLYSASAYILIAAGVIVIVTGIVGCCATLKEMKSLLIVVNWM